MIESPLGAMFEILVDGKPRSYRDTKLTAMGAAQFLKSRTPHSEVSVRDMKSGELTVVAHKPETQRQ
jgi:hypothetical protein